MNKAQIASMYEAAADEHVFGDLHNLAFVLNNISNVVSKLSKPIAKKVHAEKASVQHQKDKAERNAQDSAWKEKNFQEKKRFHDEMIRQGEERNAIQRAKFKYR